MKKERGDIWLAASGFVMQDGRILVVKKDYGATKGLWTLPSGFVNPDETVDMAAVREVREETGLIAEAEGILAVRTGVLRYGKTDNLLVFRLRPVGGELKRCETELQEIAWKTPDELIHDPDTTEFLATLVRKVQNNPGLVEHPITHTRDYGYSTYKIFI